MLSACGFRCDLCPAYRSNVSGPDDQGTISENWKKFYDINMPPEQIICDGCRSALVRGRELPAKECATRDCAVDRGLEHCGQCGEYPCERKEKLMVELEQVLEKYRGSVSAEEYSKYFEPYDARKHLSHKTENE